MAFDIEDDVPVPTLEIPVVGLPGIHGRSSR
jgi:hypothetical protein